ncbi:hypothetical protein H6A35_03705 [Collinsella tanakaei]|uniref:hypothetical protein n=1 Tax=Collinsella ihumii TaxID=1720204 RepID=UPI00195D7949|nr:hypothetical protein [Collinsella ihumii]MBM6687975.1 hypothetical protein [Collinsella tanakaei]MDN0054547.1 hypothetical protein [Collinsella ihumii]
MSSRKPSANAKRIGAFRASLGDMGDLFEREQARRDELAAEREEALYDKACASKNRYATRADALDAAARCASHGTRGLHVYKCPYCNGWHLTSKAPRS